MNLNIKQVLADTGAAAKGTVEYQNFDYPGGLHYTANVICANVNQGTETATFVWQIPAGFLGLSGLYVIAQVTDGGTPGTNGDTYGHMATASLATALGYCSSGSAPVTSYAITGGNLVVH